MSKSRWYGIELLEAQFLALVILDEYG